MAPPSTLNTSPVLTNSMHPGEGALIRVVPTKNGWSDGQSSSPKKELVYRTVSPGLIPARLALPEVFFTVIPPKPSPGETPPKVRPRGLSTTTRFSF